MPLSWLRGKEIHAPSDIELELVDALEAVTKCVDEHDMCSNVSEDAHATIDRAKQALGIVS